MLSPFEGVLTKWELYAGTYYFLKGSCYKNVWKWDFVREKLEIWSFEQNDELGFCDCMWFLRVSSCHCILSDEVICTVDDKERYTHLKRLGRSAPSSL